MFVHGLFRIRGNKSLVFKFQISKYFLSVKSNCFIFFVMRLSSGHQCADNFPATEVEEYCAKDTPADEQQVRRRAVDCQCPSGEYLMSDKSRKKLVYWGCGQFEK